MKKLIVRYNNLSFKVQASETNTSIKDSYRAKSIDDMRYILEYISAESSENMAIHKRTMFSMINEWRTHNLLYSLKIKRDRTGTVDLDINQPWYMKMFYFILSPFYPHFFE